MAMQTLLTGSGFLGTRAPLHSDLSLLLILFTAVMFTTGWRLAVGKKFETHRRVQTSATILNTMVVLAVMIASFIIYILPGLPEKFFEGTYGVTTVHAVIGMLGLLLGVFVVLRANGLVPKRLRFKNYKLFMRTSYALYMLATLVGVIVYVAVYILPD
jgi:uncharacterized membrane protein YozB (DUF420 family)